MFGLKKFYVSYMQDAGMPMTCHAVIEAPDKVYAHEHWVDLICKQGYACSPMGSPPYEYDELIEVPSTMDDKAILEAYG